MHADSIQLYDGPQTTIIGNYFHDDATHIMAPDGGDHSVITDNVFVGTDGYSTVQLGSHNGTQFAHNTVVGVNINMDSKVGNPPSTNGVMRDNLMVRYGTSSGSTFNTTSGSGCSMCTISYNLFSASDDSVGTNAIIGTPSFVGGSDPATYAGFQLAVGSPGKGNASDGLDRGVRQTGGGGGDTTAPDTSITAQPPNPTNSTSASFSLTGTDNVGVASYECKLDAGAYVACSSPTAYSSLSAGAHTFSVRAKDAAGNVDPTPATVSWMVDTVAPGTTITAQPSNPATSTSASFSFTSEFGATFQCKLDAGAYGSCTSPKSYSGLTVGSHTFNVRAIDAAGNRDPTPASYTWSINSGGAVAPTQIATVQT